MSGVSQGVSNQRFSPKSFRYNGRMASVLLPSLVVLVGYGGPLVAGVLIVSSFYFAICLSDDCILEWCCYLPNGDGRNAKRTS